jgi:hypothetical protein
MTTLVAFVSTLKTKEVPGGYFKALLDLGTAVSELKTAVTHNNRFRSEAV